MGPVAEEKYEATIDVHGISNGPRVGRWRAINKVNHLQHLILFICYSTITMQHSARIEKRSIVVCMMPDLY